MNWTLFDLNFYIWRLVSILIVILVVRWIHRRGLWTVVFHWLSRYALGVVFIYSGYVKTEATLQFASAITGYKIVPENLIYPTAQYFPWVEIALGIIILSGLEIRWSSVVASGLMLFFIALLSITLYRGIETNCGCFGFGDLITWKTIARDGSFLIPALFLVVESRLPKRVRWVSSPA